ncbi:MAG: hypothetical protein J6A87_01270 [Clostridia bacterium]|nr:hypothetical protein [Clostridia bacterium]
MNRNFRLSVALDVDDLLMSCTEYAIQLANEKYKYDPPITIYEASGWGKLGTRVDIIHEFFGKAEFYETMPVLEGAKEFVEKLSKKAEIFISTAVPPEFMGIRAKRIREEFPQIPSDHIYMGARKDKITTDILFDDALHNVLNSNAQYPILIRRPWNQESTGMLAVNTYDEFLKVVDVIAQSYAKQDYKPILSEPSIVVLVGPSGCGKSKLAKRLLRENDQFEKPISYTTKDPTATEENDWYQYVSVDKFREMVESGEMFQSTMYSGHGYGSVKSDVESILAQGKHVITTMDICGAMSLKTHFNNVTTIYVSRQKKKIIETILRKNSSIKDKANRIMGLDFCESNQSLCDYVVTFNTYDEAYEKLCEILKIK